MKKYLILVLVFFLCNNISYIKASETAMNVINQDYFEVHSGGEYEQKKNQEIINTFDDNVLKQTRGWGESCYPTVPTYKQENGYYCGPASLQMTLKHITGTKFTQTELANCAGTNKDDGTYVYKMSNTLNEKQSKLKYAYVTVSSSLDLESKVTKSIYKEAPVIFHLKTKGLKMYNGNNIGHYVVGHTIYQPSYDPAVQIIYNDPFEKNYGVGNVYGEHTDTLTNFYRCLTEWGQRYLIYSG